MGEHRRLVFDTNVLISAALFKDSTSGRALQAAIRHREILLSPATAQELQEVLARPKFDRYVQPTTRKRFMAAILRTATIVEIEQTIHECRDPKDDKFLDLAVGGNASFIVTGDDDLLVLNPFRGISIATPSEFLEILSQ
jgi:putative PIN family toxin of toxin-antitoxin system